MESSEIIQNRVNMLCRTCLQNLFEGNEYNIFLIPDVVKWLSVCTSLVIEEDDEYPKYVCSICYKKIQEFYEFREMCLNSMQKFKNTKLSLHEESLNANNVHHNQVEACLNGSEIEEELVDDKDSLSKKVDNSETISETIDSENDDDPDEDRDDFIPLVELSEETENVSDFKKHKSEGSSTTKSKKIIRKPRESYTCDSCNKLFYSKVKYDAHMRVHAGQKAWECTVCNKQFKKYYSLKEHLNKIHGPQENRPSFTCTYEGCDKSYKYKDGLRSHIKQVHSGNEVNKEKVQFICEECGKIMSTTQGLKRHIMVHSGDYPHQCNLCPRRYIQKAKLDEHIRRHNGIKNYECSICGLKKVTQRDLNVHMNNHTKEKVTKCALCEYTSTSRASVKRHENVVHHGIKAYVCKYCGNCFGKSETLKLHERTHTGEKPYECHICGRRFTQRTPLKMHIRRHEKDSAVETTFIAKSKK